MKYIYLNLKRFDIPPELGGVNRLAPPEKWAETIVTGTEARLLKYDPAEVEFVQYFPEAHILAAAAARKGPVRVGCQGVYRADTAVGGTSGPLPPTAPPTPPPCWAAPIPSSATVRNETTRRGFWPKPGSPTLPPSTAF